MVTEYHDQFGRVIELNSPPRRVVSLVPSISELLAYYSNRIDLLGVTKFCTHPKNLRSQCINIGGTKNIDIDAIVKLNPDIVIANKEENVKEQVDLLSKKLPVWISDVNTLEGAVQMIQRLELLFNIPHNFQINGTIKQQLPEVQNIYSGSVLYLIWNRPIMCAGKNTFIDAWLTHLGYTNCIQQERYPEISDERIKALQPDYIFLSSEPYHFKEKNRVIFQEKFPDSKVQLVDGRWFSWYGSTMLDAISFFRLTRIS